MSKNKQLLINLFTTLVVLVINILINFGLSSYIVKNIGEEAYGFISLANNFVSYAVIITNALNSMASRFITLDIQKSNLEGANKYFSSVLIANIILVLLLIIPAFVLIYYLDSFINISSNLVFDVRLLFAFIFLNFFVSLVGGVFSVATYCTNKIYLSSIKNMESYIIKAIIIVFLFICFDPSLFYVGIATLISGIYVVLFNIIFTKKLIPNISVNKKYFSFENVKVLLSSGIWNSITNLGNTLTDGLDLLISNLAVDATTMGIVAISKVPSNVFNTILSSVSNVFQPQIMQYYSKDDMQSVALETNKAMKISGIFGNIPFVYISVFGTTFCKCWMPGVDNLMLSSLVIISFINVFVGGLITPLYNVFTITNKVKLNSILNILTGLLSTLLVFMFLKLTKFGAYAIVGVSAMIGLLKNFIITPIYASGCLNVKKTLFFKTILQYILSSIIMFFCFLVFKIFVKSYSNILVILSIVVCGIIGLIIDFYVLCGKSERIILFEFIKNKFGGINGKKFK